MRFNPYQPPEAPCRPPPTTPAVAGRLTPTRSDRADRSVLAAATAVAVFYIPPLCLFLAVKGIRDGHAGWRSPRRAHAALGIAFGYVAIIMTGLFIGLALPIYHSTGRK